MPAPENPGSNETPETPGTEASATIEVSDIDLWSNTANFGKVFKWTARPTALKVTYKAKVGIVDKVGTYDKEGSEYKGKQDNSRIFAAVVDWSKQHGVTSGMGEPSGMWDPVKKTELEVCPLWS